MRYAWVILGMAVCLSGNVELTAQQDNGRFQPRRSSEVMPNTPVPEWVTELPVSMNGKLPKKVTGSIYLWKPGAEKKLWHTAYGNSGLYTADVRKNHKAEQYFKDPRVIELCNAIFAADMATIKAVVNGGVKVNTVGKGGVTPLFWAFLLDTDPRPFDYLLNHGADPNVVASFPATAKMGWSVAHKTCVGSYNRHFKKVFESGGDPNLRNRPVHNDYWSSPFSMLSHEAPDAIERLQLLIEKGADLDLRTSGGQTFASKRAKTAIESDMQCRMILKVLEAGADYKAIHKQERIGAKPNTFEGCYFRLIHDLAWAELKLALNEESIKKPPQYKKLIAWLEERGESLEEAKFDLVRWRQLIEQGRTDLIDKEFRESRFKKSGPNRKLLIPQIRKSS